MMPLIGDEAIRATVALEMMLSGDYITPTLAGEIYLNKPPLYNWILTVFFRAAGSESEFMVRLPSTIFLIVYSISIFLWIRKPLGKQSAILTALAFLTCSRILFWDSFLGLIDICYSWIMFSNFMIIWHCFRRQSYHKMFLISYLLVAIGFLLKGLPTIVFQGITLLSVLIIERKIKMLFSWRHFAGIGIFIILTGSYYLTYYFKNPHHFPDLMLRLVSESTQKSAIGAGFEKTILHLFTFPFEIIYHFVPWTLLVVFLFHKRILRKAMMNHFILYCTVIFIANCIVYWLSPITYPRYLLMLMPLLFIVFLQLSRYHAITNTLNYRVVVIVFLIFVF
jgi:4-amino-4-deoxy-L-arabinose transferase-like glycosyltransferase